MANAHPEHLSAAARPIERRKSSPILILAVCVGMLPATFAERQPDPEGCPPGVCNLEPPPSLAGPPAKPTIERWTPTPEEAGRALQGGFTDLGAPLESGGDYWRRNLFKRVISDQKFLITTWAPQEGQRPAMYIPLAVGVLGALGSSRAHPGADYRLSQTISDWGGSHVSGTAHVLSTVGDGAAGLAILGSTYLVARWTGHSHMARATSLSVEALANTAIWSTALKSLTRRARPYETVGGEFLVSDPGVTATSFPSGHSMGAFSVAAVMAREYRGKRWVPWVAYGSAGLIAASRVALGRHYVSDVVVGGLLGYSLGRMVSVRQHGDERPRLLDRIEPMIDPGSGGVGLVYHHTW